jgi:hypothetical protein
MRSMPPHWGRAALILLLIGATIGPVLDALHTFPGATHYAAPQFLKSVWWCPPLFAGAALALGFGRLFTERLLRVPLVDPGMKTASLSMTLFVLGYAASGFLPVSEVLKAALLLAAALVVFVRLDRSLAAALCALGAGLGGWVVEHTLVGQGLFFHRDTFLDGIPLWLPPLYFLAAFAVGHLVRRLQFQAPG